MGIMVLAYPGQRWQVNWLRRIWTIVCLDKQKIDEVTEPPVKVDSGSAKLRIRAPSGVHCGSCEDFKILATPEETAWTCKNCTGSL